MSNSSRNTMGKTEESRPKSSLRSAFRDSRPGSVPPATGHLNPILSSFALTCQSIMLNLDVWKVQDKVRCFTEDSLKFYVYLCFSNFYFSVSNIALASIPKKKKARPRLHCNVSLLCDAKAAFLLF
jgi:hypothetical protein